MWSLSFAIQFLLSLVASIRSLVPLPVCLGLRLILRSPEMGVFILLALPPALYALPAAWWGLSAYMAAYILTLLAWGVTLAWRFSRFS